MSSPLQSRQSDQRRGLRRIALKGGKIVFNSGRSVLECRIRDLSPTGARLELTAPQLLPHAFDLHITGSPPRGCELRWAKGNFAGVQFKDSE